MRRECEWNNSDVKQMLSLGKKRRMLLNGLGFPQIFTHNSADFTNTVQYIILCIH